MSIAIVALMCVKLNKDDVKVDEKDGDRQIKQQFSNA